MTQEELKHLDIAEFAERFYGFKKTAKNTKNSPSLKNDNGEHIVIKYHPNGTCTFFAPGTDRKGDIFNFVEWQQNCGFKEAKDHIVKTLGIEIDKKKEEKPVSVASAPKGKEFDKGSLTKLKPVEAHPYLEERGIPAEIIKHKRFFGTILTDEWNNAVFPHLKDNKIVGFTKKNYKFSGFSEGGEKLLWKSNQFEKDNRLVVAESAIDALSIATLESGNQKTKDRFFHERFISIDGGMSANAEEALKKEVQAMPEQSVIVAAFDNDEQGKKYLAKLAEICKECGKKLEENLPKVRKDWNEVLVTAQERARNKAESVDDATEKQKDTIRKMVQEGHLTNINETYLSRMKKATAKKLIFVGMQNAKKNVKSEEESPEMSM